MLAWVLPGASFAAVVGPWILFRLLYFGELLPNTYFAKRMPLDLSVGTGLYYVGTYVAASGAIPLLAVGLAWLGRRAIIEFLERNEQEELQLPLMLPSQRADSGH